jgi:hypothetical protein
MSPFGFKVVLEPLLDWAKAAPKNAEGTPVVDTSLTPWREDRLDSRR